LKAPVLKGVESYPVTLAANPDAVQSPNRTPNSVAAELGSATGGEITNRQSLFPFRRCYKNRQAA
jgi:hypothetical protein